MIEKFGSARSAHLNEFLDLNHTRSILIFVSLLIPKFARVPFAWRGELRHQDTIALAVLASPLGFALVLVVMFQLHENLMQ